MILVRYLIAGVLILLAQQAEADVRSSAVSRSVMRPENRASLMKGATYANSTLRSLHSRSNFGPSALAAISRRSEHDAGFASRLRAEYSPAELLVIERRSENGPGESRVIDAASDPTGILRGSASPGIGVWADRVNRQSIPPPDILQGADALRALLLFVQRRSVSTGPPAPAPDERSRRGAILSQSAD
jgi:hypothetical protein